jgi:hypothetical protein
MLTMFADGRFLLGGQDNEPTCVPNGYPYGDLDEDGNGVEYGTTTLINGVVTPTPTVDSNGECGLYDATKEFTQRYIFVPNAAGDALVMWSNDDDSAAGLVWKRVPSVSNAIYGAWLWHEGVQHQLAVVAYLPGDVMFEASVFPDATGLRREKFDFSAAPTMKSTIAGYQYCVDTQNAPEDNECDGDPSFILEEEYVVEGDTIVDDDEVGSITRIQ